MNYDAVSLPFSVIFLSFWSRVGESEGIRGASARIGYEEIKVAFERRWALDPRKRGLEGLEGIT